MSPTDSHIGTCGPLLVAPMLEPVFFVCLFVCLFVFVFNPP